MWRSLHDLTEIKYECGATHLTEQKLNECGGPHLTSQKLNECGAPHLTSQK